MNKLFYKYAIKTMSVLLLLLLAILPAELAIQQLVPNAVAAEAEFPGEKIVHLLQEPRHRTVYNQDGLFLLDVQVNPGDISFPHIHDQAILLTSISSGGGPSNGTVRAITDYASTSLTHKVSNAGPGLLRIIAFVNDGSGVSGDSRDNPSGMPIEPQIENPWFRSYRIELDPGEETPIQTHQNPTVIVQGSDGLVHVTREDGITDELDAPGDWAWRQPDSPFRLRNMGRSSVVVAINEGRQ
jgi:quercetin dioxygenase-like cupin family protein